MSIFGSCSLTRSETIPDREIGGYRPLSNAAGPPSQSFAGGNGRPLPAMQGNSPDIPLFSLQ